MSKRPPLPEGYTAVKPETEGVGALPDLPEGFTAAKPDTYEETPKTLNERNKSPYDVSGGITGLLGEVGTAIKDTPVHIAGSAARAYQGTKPFSADGQGGISDALIQASEDVATSRRNAPDADQSLPWFGELTRGEVSGDTGASLGFSGANAIAGLTAGLGTTALTGNVAAGYAAGAGVSGLAAHQMAANQFLRDTINTEDEERIAKTGEGMTNEEKVARQEELNTLANEYGLYEAIPEAASNVAGLKVLTAPLKKMLGKNVATKVIAKMGAFYGQELATETVTGMGQQRVEAEIDEKQDPRQFDDIGDWAETFKEIAPQTILLSTIMGGAGTVGVKVHQKTVSDPRRAKAYKDAATQPDQIAMIPDKELDRLIEAGDELVGRRKNDTELRVAVAQLSKEKENRAAQVADQLQQEETQRAAEAQTKAGIQAATLAGERETLDQEYQDLVYANDMEGARKVEERLKKLDEQLQNVEVEAIEAAPPAPAEPGFGELGPEYDDVDLAEPMPGTEGIDVTIDRPLTSELADRFRDRVAEYRQKKVEDEYGVEELDRVPRGTRREDVLARENLQRSEDFKRQQAEAPAEQPILPTAEVVELTPEEVEAGVIDEVRPQSGNPYRSEKSAANMAKIRKLDNYVPVEKDGGWVLQRKRGTDQPLPDLTEEAAGIEVKETKDVPEKPKVGKAPERVPGGSQLRDALKGAGVQTQAQKDDAEATAKLEAKLEKEFPRIPRQAGLPEEPRKPLDIDKLLAGETPNSLKRQAGFGKDLPPLEPTPPTDEGGTPEFLAKKTEEEVLYGGEPKDLPPSTEPVDRTGGKPVGKAQERINKNREEAKARVEEKKQAENKKKRDEKIKAAEEKIAEDKKKIKTLEDEIESYLRPMEKREGSLPDWEESKAAFTEGFTDRAEGRERNPDRATGPGGDSYEQGFRLGSNGYGLPRRKKGGAKKAKPTPPKPTKGGTEQTEPTPPKDETGTTPIEDAAAEAATNPANDIPEPTEGQKEAGNYKKGHVSVQGMGVSIENPAGSKRNPDWPALKNHYGYLKGTQGPDKDHIDIFLGDNAEEAGTIFVIDQINPETGAFDEHKVVLGPFTEEEAVALYNSNYGKGWKGAGAVTEMDMEEFKEWVYDKEQTQKPLALKEETPAAATPADEVPTNIEGPAAGNIMELLREGSFREAYELAKARGRPLRFGILDGKVVPYASTEWVADVPLGRKGFVGRNHEGQWHVVDLEKGVTLDGPDHGNTKAQTIQAMKDRSEWSEWTPERQQDQIDTFPDVSQEQLEAQFVSELDDPPILRPRPEPEPSDNPTWEERNQEKDEEPVTPYRIPKTRMKAADLQETIVIDEVEGGGEVRTPAIALVNASKKRVTILNELGECIDA